MKTPKSIVDLIRNILLQPKSTIMSVDIISYDKELLDKLFFFVSMIYGFVIGIFYMGRFNLGISMIYPLLTPFIIFVGYKIYALITYFLVKLIGNDIKINYDIIQIVLKPIFLVYLILLITSTTFKILFNSISINIILSIILAGWINIILFLIIHHKLKQNIYRSISIIIISIVIIFILLLHL